MSGMCITKKTNGFGRFIYDEDNVFAQRQSGAENGECNLNEEDSGK